MNLQGRTALVTGGSRGIGRGIALALAQAGADVAINYRRDEAAAKATVADIEALGRKAMAYQADVANYDQVKEMVARVGEAMGKIDILVSNAGIISRGLPISDTDITEVQRLMNINFFGAFHCIQAILPHMRKQPRGDIILISSRAALACMARRGPYAASKAALEALGKCLAKEEQPNNIRVNIIGPGLVETEMGRRMVKARHGVDIKEIYATQPFGRVSQPEDIGHLVVFLCSKEGEYITGQVIYVHGGDDRG